MASRDFDAARRERQRQRKPISFTLGGETLTCLAVVPVGVGFDLVDAPEPDGTPSDQGTVALANFIREVLVDGDRDRFEAALRNRAEPVEPEDLLAVVQWLSEEYARPTSPSSGSSNGRRTAGRSSSARRTARDSET